MSLAKYIWFVALISLANITFAQKNERDYLRSGNKLYNDSLFVKAEVSYRKTLDINPKSTEAMYNLGNALSQQQKFKEAMEQYDTASRVEKNKMKLSKIYHNMGVISQAAKQYPQAIAAYKQALRNNPKDEETRYNLALAQSLLKEQQNQDNKDNKEDEKDQQQQNQDQKDQQKKDEQQPPKPKQNENQMSKENAEQLLNSVMQDEKDVQDKVKKQLRQAEGRQLDKDW